MASSSSARADSPKKYYRWNPDLDRVLFSTVLKTNKVEVDDILKHWPIEETPPSYRSLRDHLHKVKTEGADMAKKINVRNKNDREFKECERKFKADALARAEAGEPPLTGRSASKLASQRAEELEKRAAERAEKMFQDGTWVPKKWISEEEFYNE